MSRRRETSAMMSFKYEEEGNAELTLDWNRPPKLEQLQRRYKEQKKEAISFQIRPLAQLVPNESRCFLSSQVEGRGPRQKTSG
jgi:hypothetical protein